MTDAKPDPLEELKAELEGVPIEFSWHRSLHKAIAAWEKERARLDREVNQNQGMATMLLNLRAAVEKVRETIREDIQIAIDAGARGDDSVFDLEDVQRYHDALDAALRGGA